MRAFLVLAAIYVAAFLIAVQGASQTSVEGAMHRLDVSHIDPAKEADIRSLMDMVGARAMVRDAAAQNAKEIRENLIATVPANDRGQQFVDAFVADYQKRFNPEEVAGQLVGIYDRHFTDDELKGLMEFYGSPLGRKFAVEMPKITSEIQAANHAAGTRVAKDVLADLPNEYAMNARPPAVKAQPPTQARPVKRWPQTPAPTQPESMASASQP
jgi:uncharacterized protein